MVMIKTCDQDMCKKFDLFEIHIKKIEKSDGTIVVICNYYSKEFKWSESKGYDTYRRHVNNDHPIEIAKLKAKRHINFKVRLS